MTVVMRASREARRVAASRRSPAGLPAKHEPDREEKREKEGVYRRESDGLWAGKSGVRRQEEERGARTSERGTIDRHSASSGGSPVYRRVLLHPAPPHPRSLPSFILPVARSVSFPASIARLRRTSSLLSSCSSLPDSCISFSPTLYVRLFRFISVSFFASTSPRSSVTNDGHKQKQLFPTDVALLFSFDVYLPPGRVPSTSAFVSGVPIFSVRRRNLVFLLSSLFHSLCLFFLSLSFTRSVDRVGNRNEVVMKDPYALACHEPTSGVGEEKTLAAES